MTKDRGKQMLREALRDEHKAPKDYRAMATKLKGRVPKSDLTALRNIAKQESQHHTTVNRIIRHVKK